MLAGEPQTDGRRPLTAHPGRRACPLGERRLQGDAGDRLPNAVRNRPSVSRAPRDPVRESPAFCGGEPRWAYDRPGPRLGEGASHSVRIRHAPGRPRSAQGRTGPRGTPGRGVHPVRTELAAVLHPAAARTTAERDHDGPLLRERLTQLFLPSTFRRAWTAGPSPARCGSSNPVTRWRTGAAG